MYTLNNWNEQDCERLQAVECTYLVYGKEVGEEGTPHLQGFVYFKNKKSFKQVKQLLGERCHIEAMKGSAAQAAAYCKKDGVVFEKGVAPQKSGGDTVAERAKKNKRLRDEDLNKLVEEGVLAMRDVNAIKKARLILANEKPHFDAEGVRGIWIVGPPGTGKTHAARNEYGGPLYIKSQNKWFDGYQGEPVIVLDDLDKGGECLGHYLKIWTDKWACTGEVKGGTVPLQHKLFIITSNYEIDELFEDEKMVSAISRRFKVVRKQIKYAD